jgi:FlaA1/EpsC-like NDP-sugar epimerase
MNKRLITLKIIQVAVDAALILAAFALAYFLRVGFIFSSVFPFHQYYIIALITLPFTLIFMFFIRAYKMSQRIWSFRHFQRIAFVAVENVFVFMIFYYFAYRAFFSRLILLYIVLLTTAFVFGWHLLFRWIMQKHSQREKGVYRTLIIGANRPAEDLVGHLLRTKSHIKPVAVIDAYGSKKPSVHGVPIVGKMNVFERTIANHNIDLIIQADNLEQSLNIINYALQNNIKYMMPPELLGVFQGHQMIEEVEGVPLLKIHKSKPWWSEIW